MAVVVDCSTLVVVDSAIEELGTTSTVVVVDSEVVVG